MNESRSVLPIRGARCVRKEGVHEARFVSDSLFVSWRGTRHDAERSPAPQAVVDLYEEN